MENLQTNFSLVQGSNKKLNGMGDDGSLPPPMKKMMTDIHANGKMINKVPTVKKEHVDDFGEAPMETDGEYVKRICKSVPESLNLNPSLKHTLAQFHLSSQSSLGDQQHFLLGIPKRACPLLYFCLFHCLRFFLAHCSSLLIAPQNLPRLLEGVSISCFQVGGEKRLCLPPSLKFCSSRIFTSANKYSV